MIRGIWLIVKIRVIGITMDRGAAMHESIRAGHPVEVREIADRADAITHLAQQVMCWMGWSVFHADPRRGASSGCVYTALFNHLFHSLGTDARHTWIFERHIRRVFGGAGVGGLQRSFSPSP